MKAHYVLLSDRALLVSAARFSDWRQLQEAFPDFVTSLGPWSEDELLDYLTDDFGSASSWPLTRAEIAAFFLTLSQGQRQD